MSLSEPHQQQQQQQQQNGQRLLQVKSKYLAEFRRFSLNSHKDTYVTFIHQIEFLHRLGSVDTVITYTDPVHGDLLPINNEENFSKAKKSCNSHGLLRIYVHKKDNYVVSNGFGQSTVVRRKGKKKPVISLPEDFRPVSAIIDVDILPESLRRVRLHNHGANKPLGFFIRDGVSLRVSEERVEKIPGIFISRLVQGGLAEMTGLLAVNDEVLEVNGIEVAGKSLDQVTDMMVANSSNLIVTVKPASMRNCGAGSQRSAKSQHQRPPLNARTRYQYRDSEGDSDGDEIIDDIDNHHSQQQQQRPPQYQQHDRRRSSVYSSGDSRNNYSRAGGFEQQSIQRSSNVLSSSSSRGSLQQSRNHHHHRHQRKQHGSAGSGSVVVGGGSLRRSSRSQRSNNNVVDL